MLRNAGRAALRARLFSHGAGPRPRTQAAAPPRLYVAEGTPSITGGMAEHRFRMRTSEVEAFAVRSLRLNVGDGRDASAAVAVAKDLNANRGASIVIAGEYQPPRVHAMAHALNAGAGQRGKDGDLYRPGGSESGG